MNEKGANLARSLDWQSQITLALSVERDADLLYRLCEIIDRANEPASFDEQPRLATLVDTADWFRISTGASGMFKFLLTRPHGALAHEAMEWFAEIGAQRSADYLREAAAAFPNGHILADDEVRSDLYDAIEKERPRFFAELDRRYRDTGDELPACVRRLLLANPGLIDDLVLPPDFRPAERAELPPGAGGLVALLAEHARRRGASSESDKPPEPQSRLEQLRQSKLGASIGDVLELLTPKGLAYLQVGHGHDLEDVTGPLVRVLPGLFASRPANLDEIVRQETAFWLLFEAVQALRDRDAQKVGAFAIPESATS